MRQGMRLMRDDGLEKVRPESSASSVPAWDEQQVRRQAISASPSAKPYDKTASSTESPWNSHARDAIPRVATVSPPKAAAIAAPASASTAALPNPPRTEPSPVAHSAKPNAISAIARAASPPIRAVARVTVDLSGPIHQDFTDGFAGRTTAGQAHELLGAATDEEQRFAPGAAPPVCG